jgi:hypothetical protein
MPAASDSIRVLSRPQPARGLSKQRAEAGASVFKIMEVLRHKSVDAVHSYVRRADQFQEYAWADFP